MDGPHRAPFGTGSYIYIYIFVCTLMSNQYWFVFCVKIFDTTVKHCNRQSCNHDQSGGRDVKINPFTSRASQDDSAPSSRQHSGRLVQAAVRVGREAEEHCAEQVWRGGAQPRRGVSGEVLQDLPTPGHAHWRHYQVQQMSRCTGQLW